MKVLILAALAMLASVNAYADCRGEQCPLYVKVSVTPHEQLMYIYYQQNGRTELIGYQVSSGMEGHQTPEYEGHPLWLAENDYHDSSIYPEGDYQDPQTGKSLGNMPYAMFFTNEGHAIHGTPIGNFRKIGKPVSHGCIRMYSDQAKTLNRLVRKYKRANTWFSITRSRVGTAEGQREYTNMTEEPAPVAIQAPAVNVAPSVEAVEAQPSELDKYKDKTGLF